MTHFIFRTKKKNETMSQYKLVGTVHVDAPCNVAGSAFCASLGLYAVSCLDTHTVFVYKVRNQPELVDVCDGNVAYDDVEEVGYGRENDMYLKKIAEFGRRAPDPSMNFKFGYGQGTASWDVWFPKAPSGALAFTDKTADLQCMLLVADEGHACVHILDVVTHAHMGHVGGPSSIASPSALATTGTKIALSCFDSSEWAVRLYDRDPWPWTLRRRIPCVSVSALGAGRMAGYVHAHTGCHVKNLAFTADKQALLMQYSLFNVGEEVSFDGEGDCVRRVVFDSVGFMDTVIDAGDGWLMMSEHHGTVEYLPKNEPSMKQLQGVVEGLYRWHPPGTRCMWLLHQDAVLIVANNICKDLVIYATPAWIAKTKMSAIRVAWMCAVVRSILLL